VSAFRLRRWIVPALAAVGAAGQLAACRAGAVLGPRATPTAAVTAIPTASATPLASPTPTAHPLQIRWLRERQYAAAPLLTETVLPSGAGYDRSVVSYLSDGLRIRALLTVPQGAPPATGWPVVVFNHGYIPPAQYRTTERYVAYVDAFARAGYIVLKSDYRGHGSSEGQAGGGYGSPNYTVDVLHGLAAVRAHPLADPARVGMWGHSMGGWITLRSMVVTDTVKAGVIWAGVVGSYDDLFQRWRRPGAPTAGAPTAGAPPAGAPTAAATRRSSWRTDLVARFGSPEDNPEFWSSISANAFLSDIAGPLQLHHGDADKDVPLLFSEILAQGMADAGREAELFVYPGDDHNLSANLRTALSRSVAFFDQHVKAAPAAPTP